MTLVWTGLSLLAILVIFSADFWLPLVVESYIRRSKSASHRVRRLRHVMMVASIIGVGLVIWFTWLGLAWYWNLAVALFYALFGLVVYKYAPPYSKR